jgi:hypothetical protein
MARKVAFLVAELGPDVDPFVLHLFAALAEKERALISARTRKALSAAEARGVTLGNSRPHMARKSAVEAVKSEADTYAAKVLPIIREAQNAGARTLRQIAEAFNARGIATARGGQWYAQSVANVLARALGQHWVAIMNLGGAEMSAIRACGRNRVAFRPKRTPDGRQARRDQSRMDPLRTSGYHRWQWLPLPGLQLEAGPGVRVFPFWQLTSRRRLDSTN